MSAKRTYPFFLILAISGLCFGCSSLSLCQTKDSVQEKTIQQINGISEKALQVMNKRYDLLQRMIEKQTEKMLKRMQKREEELQKKLNGIDSVKSKQLFAQTKSEYQRLARQLASPASFSPGFAQKVRMYIPKLDSFQTVLNFYEQKGLNIPVAKLDQLQALSTKMKLLQAKFQVAGAIQQYFQLHEQQLKNQLSNLGMNKELLGINKEAYYYQQRMNQYKGLVNDKDKLKSFILTEVTTQKPFQNFWQKHSYLASIFPMPQQDGAVSVSLPSNLQTRAQINNLIQQKLGKSLPGIPGQNPAANNSTNYLEQQVQQAKSQLDQLKSKFSKLGSSGGDIVMPDFKPNNQKTKTFLQRIEYGLSMQNTPGNSLLPATSNIGAILGYKINDNMTSGVGVSYLVGWGAPIKNIHLSSQGIGLRSFIDIRAKGSFWLTAGYEDNLVRSNAITSTGASALSDKWQSSLLAGITKKIKMGNKNCNLQLLYDFLEGPGFPNWPALKFRVGYSF